MLTNLKHVLKASCLNFSIKPTFNEAWKTQSFSGVFRKLYGGFSTVSDISDIYCELAKKRIKEEGAINRKLF